MGSSNRKSIWFTRPWTTIRKVVQILVLLLFILLFVGSHAGRISGSLASLPVRLDPLIALANLIANRTFILSSILALITLGITLLAGRAWCGWLSPVYSLSLLSIRRARRFLGNIRRTDSRSTRSG